MCGRYTLSDPQSIPSRFDVSMKSVDFEASYNIAPGYITPVIVKENGENKVKMMKWGLVPFWADDPKIGYKMINARSEGIENKPAFRVPIRKKRCLIPSTGFYEWKSLKLEDKPEKYPWYYQVKDMDIFAFAGLFDEWKDKEGYKMTSYTIITTSSNELVNKVHQRMPVILDKDEEDKWIGDLKKQDTLKLLDSFPSERMVSIPVSRRVNSPKNDDKELTERVDRPITVNMFE